jgi:ubiquinol-cytochrome c reductase cytochrome b subunit
MAGANDIIAKTLDIPLYGTTWFFRIAVFVGPVLAFAISRRIALGLQRREAAMLRHGVESGHIIRRPSGEYEETEKPLDADEEAVILSRRLPRRLPPLRADRAGVEPKEARRPTARLRRRLNRLYTEDVIPLPTGEHAEGPAIEPRKPAH